MDSYGMDNYKKILLEQGKGIENTINLMKKHRTAQQDVDSPTELSNYDNHPADMGTQLFELEFNNALEVNEEHLLKEIHDALIRIDEGNYGKCEFCGGKIMKERLEALPYTRLCIDCETSKEITMVNLDRQRPVEELVWDSPFGRKYLNKKEDDEFEGLDQLNDLMKYGSSDTPQDMGGYADYKEFYTNKMDKQGLVDKMDGVSNETYKRQLPD